MDIFGIVFKELHKGNGTVYVDYPIRKIVAIYLQIVYEGNSKEIKASESLETACCSVHWTPKILVWLCKYSFLKIEEVSSASSVRPKDQAERRQENLSTA